MSMYLILCLALGLVGQFVLLTRASKLTSSQRVQIKYTAFLSPQPVRLEQFMSQKSPFLCPRQLLVHPPRKTLLRRRTVLNLAYSSRSILSDGTELQIRAAADRDDAAILQLLNRTIHEEHSLPYCSLQDMKAFKDTFIGLNGSQTQELLAIFLIGPAFPGRSAHVCEGIIITSPNHRQKGIGFAMGIALFEVAKQFQYTVMWQSIIYVTNKAAVALCRKLGMKLLSVLPKAGRLPNGQHYTDGMQFFMNLETTKRRQEVNESEAQHSKWMLEALQLAKIAEAEGEIPVGAVVVMQNKIIGKGYNRRRQSLDPSAHAEVVAMREAAHYLKNYRLEGCTLYVTLEPCAMCAGAMLEARISQMVFSARDVKGGCCGSVLDLLSGRFPHKIKTVQGIMQEEASDLLTHFFRSRNNTFSIPRALRQGAPLLPSSDQS